MARFSARVQWGGAINAIAKAVAEYRPFLDLTESNPTQAGFHYPVDEILRSVSSPESMRYEPESTGMLSARQAVSLYYNEAIPAERICLTASTSEAYSYILKLLCEPGDEILVPQPSYPLFEHLAALENVRIAPYPLSYQGYWQIDSGAIEAAMTERSRALFVVHPNNPTGSFVKKQEAASLFELCERYNMAVVSDEVFADYAFMPDVNSAGSLAANLPPVLTFSLSGLSKVAGLPQLKLGWIAVGGPEKEAQEAYERLEWIADTFLSVGAPVQHAAPHLLTLGRIVADQIRLRTAANLARLQQSVANTTLDVLNVEGGWYATVRVPRTRTEEDWTLSLLREQQVLVQPGYFYDFESEAHLVLSLLPRPKVFAEGIRRLVKFAAS